jgi:hypothetical protein
VLLERGTLDERKAIRVVGPQGWAELERRPDFRRIDVCSLSRYWWLRSRVADSVNPVTIAVAVYLSATPDPVRRLAGLRWAYSSCICGRGCACARTGELLRTAVDGVHSRGFDVVSIVLGMVIIAVAGVVWAKRGQFVGRDLSASVAAPGSGLALGAVVIAVDLRRPRFRISPRSQ